MMTAPDHAGTAPVFQHGSGSSDVLHAILRELPTITRLYGHSKGALVIANAILGPSSLSNRLGIVTFGCPVRETEPNTYCQYLGWFDGLGCLNAWGNLPSQWLAATHTTNTALPLNIPVAALTFDGNASR